MGPRADVKVFEKKISLAPVQIITNFLVLQPAA
jgi:hypothetical protein